jgi:GAF domain-containing protein
MTHGDAFLQAILANPDDDSQTPTMIRPASFAYETANVSYLQLVANQVAVSVENALAFQEIEALKDQLSKANANSVSKASSTRASFFSRII